MFCFVLLTMSVSLSSGANTWLKGSFEEKTNQAFEIMEKAKATYSDREGVDAERYKRVKPQIDEAREFIYKHYPNEKGYTTQCLKYQWHGNLCEYWCSDDVNMGCYVSSFSGQPSDWSEYCRYRI